MSARLAIAIAALFTANAAVAGEPSLPRHPQEILVIPAAMTFGDWEVACDNALHCDAIAAADAGNPEHGLVVSVARDGGADGTLTVTITPSFEQAAKLDNMRFDGAASAFRTDDDGRLIGDERAFLGMLAKARRATAGFGGEDRVDFLPTQGASAAFRYMDAKQGRAGTVTAIVARGELSANRVPPAPSLPIIAVPDPGNIPPETIDRAEVLKIQASNDFCDADADRIETHRLDADHTLAIVGCFMGAYQGASILVIIDAGGEWRFADLDQPDFGTIGADEDWRHMITGANYDEGQRLLTEWAKGRGLADCGRIAHWAWDGERFRIAMLQTLDTCFGAVPGEFLSRWQTVNSPRVPGSG